MSDFFIARYTSPNVLEPPQLSLLTQTEIYHVLTNYLNRNNVGTTVVAKNQYKSEKLTIRNSYIPTYTYFFFTNRMQNSIWTAYDAEFQ